MSRREYAQQQAKDSPLMVNPANPTEEQLKRIEAVKVALNAILGAALIHLKEPVELNKLYADELATFCDNYDFEDKRNLFETAWICFEWIQGEAIDQETFNLYKAQEELDGQRQERIRKRVKLAEVHG